jgi:plastocyanin
MMVTVRFRPGTDAMIGLALMLATAPLAAAQTLLERGPNVSGPWAIPVGVVEFNFAHRFSRSPAPERKVTGYPTFLLATGLPAHASAGVRYSTNSTLVSRYPNEWEFFGRMMPLAQARGAPLDAAVAASWNLAARGPGAELSLARTEGPARVIALGRIMADPDSSGADAALGGGLVLRLTRHIAIAGDAVTMLQRDEGERVAWSAGLQLALPNTPHTLSLHLSNTATTTMQSGSRGSSDVRFGFEFTIPVTLSRYFSGGHATGPATVASDSVVEVHIKDLKFSPAVLQVRPGTVVEWINDDPLDHTVTATDSSFTSGLIKPGTRWRHTFSAAGPVTYACTPHPFMHGEVRVERAP